MSYDYNYRSSIGLRLTPVVKWLLIANVSVFLFLVIIGRLVGESVVLYIYKHFAISFDGVFSRFELWQPLTYFFLHDAYGISHILWNMFMLWMFGSPLESLWGNKKFLRYYMLTGVLSCVVILAAGAIFASHRQVTTLGASGALYALLVAFGFAYPRTPIYLFGIFPILGKYLVMLFIVLGILQGLSLSATDVSLAGHLGGMLAGLIVVTGAWRPRVLANYLKLGWWKLRYLWLRRKIRPVDRGDRWRH